VALQGLTADVLAEATLRRHRTDPVVPGGGGPAGNARLTAATGLAALVLAGGRTGVPGERHRLVTLIVTLVIAVSAAIVLLGTADAWRHAGHRHVKRAAAAVKQAPGAAISPRH
jgi:hypothetical protein